MLNAGDLNYRITIEQNKPITSSDGTRVENWVAVVSVWADYQAKSGREFFSAQRFNAEVSALFRIRYRSDVNVKMRIRYKTRVFEILFMNDTSKDQGELALGCREVV
ncbi:phage head-tail adaptor, putative, SPP1 family [Acidaminobacter hydrogenoformans DSM 2784]|uniref:Phage head-tail adaptor, putative, SPP1 family n=2 Tax=Acidaminobacter TaxID=65402 RepID=A0A1G5S2N3_9FIRM|nr:phage head-tail adaptor, putative, SPP1 family [Acidaminobacter hydrogenoformans DSM 2784]